MTGGSVQAAAPAQGGGWRARIAPWAGSLGPRLGAFWRWWRAALLAWLPDALRERFGLWPQRLLLCVDGEHVHVTLLRGQAQALGTLDVVAAVGTADPLAARLPAALADVPRWLLLPESAVLRRRLRLPAAAAERLHDVTGFEIDRQTPFASTDVVHDARVLGARADGQLEVELIVLTRAALEAALARLGPLAAGLSGVDVAVADGAPLGINLMPAARRHRRRSRASTTHAALLALAVLLFIAALWQMLDNRRAAVLEWQRTVAGHSEAARDVAQAQRRVLELVEGAAFLDAERARRPGMVEIMAELARRLPDATHLDKLAIEGNRITLIGLSADAPALVGRLQDSPLWHAPALAGVVQSDPATRLDRFTLIAELTTAPAPTEGSNVRAP